jgi:DNA modification methylase
VAVTLLEGDCRALLPTLPAASVHCVVTSPPYWGLRDYGTATWDGGDAACLHRKSELRRGVNLAQSAASTRGGAKKAAEVGWLQHTDECPCGARRIDQQLGLEPTPEAYVARMVEVFREVRRVLRDDGTLWLNMGDSYVAQPPGACADPYKTTTAHISRGERNSRVARESCASRPARDVGALKQKDLVGIPWRLAFALQADGWYLRSDIIWAKPNPMPESVTDRPTKAHEYVFLLSKAARYFYDADAVREPHTAAPKPRGAWCIGDAARDPASRTDGMPREGFHNPAGRNLRSVWTIPSAPFPDAHFATFPPALASRCIQAGTSEKGCCAACGAPWAREIDRADDARPVINGSRTKAALGGPTGAERRLGPNGWNLPTAIRQTTGWHATCEHEAAVMPATVLDPFAGSGTVGEVAEALGRHSVLIELSPTYVQMAQARTAQCGLFTQPAPASA